MRLFLALLCLFSAAPVLAQRIDGRPRTAIMTAFPPEHAALAGHVERVRTVRVNGVPVMLGTMAGKPVLLVESGVSMVNAAMTTQWLVDRFNVKRILFSGIAGGIDPTLHIGDVVVAADWSQYLETTMARETDKGYVPIFRTPGNDLPNFGMIFPRDVEVGNRAEAKSWHRAFTADTALLAIARDLSLTESLARCVDVTAVKCLPHQPALHVGGRGISGPAFMDNAAYRQYLFTTFQARVLDMESAAVAQVAYANRVPFIAFRSLSDLAGGDAENNQMTIFMTLASANSARVVRDFVSRLPD
ncbi:5'-methylthioadenosine/S-adenosylhomocysteine nucleosidase [Sphingobium sp. AP49]|uniref:5'-methylthioadenosine/S-adenosylhomocysteine nucleosidase n=1 Tax=Sphingobium sp. AP49 TaxID=1144307 RepID=UPI00026ED6DD|nr:5'-methylthioadenosine/S-adenosylhomocysteine nucleosidase [Sphingobium sp. AP49]WHO37246.1 5'-methylthioadenosine/S-adenosylhomocysteine nucleosidase [Sphingobium sp. AP49]